MTVLARKRGLSSKEFFNKALAIREQVFVLAHKEKVIPKSKRFTFTVPLCDLARSLVRNIEKADAFYPNSSWAVIERKKYLSLAMADVNSLYDEIALLVSIRGGAKKGVEWVVCPFTGHDCKPIEPDDGQPNGGENGIDLNEFAPLLKDLADEYKLLKGTKNAVKLLGRETEEDKLQAAEAEAQRLRDLILMREGYNV